jgi:hypothetical protein
MFYAQLVQGTSEHLRSRAEYYRRAAARAEKRLQFLFCRALATHFEREAEDFERIIGKPLPATSGPMRGRPK